METLTPKLELEIRAFRNVRYHEDREGHFQAMARWANFATVVFGSAAFAGGWAEAHGFSALSGALAALVGGSQLAFDFAGKAVIHHDLRRRFLEILGEAAGGSATAIQELNKKMQEIYADEPEVYNAVNALATNASQKAFSRVNAAQLVVTKRQELLRHWLRFDPNDFPEQKPTIGPIAGSPLSALNSV